MNWHRCLAALLIILALTACAQGGQVPYAPENMHDRGGDGGGGGECPLAFFFLRCGGCWRAPIGDRDAEIGDFLEGFNQPTYRSMRINGVRVATWSSRDGWSGDSRPDAEWLQ
jgi:hypothetical protein